MSSYKLITGGSYIHFVVFLSCLFLDFQLHSFLYGRKCKKVKRTFKIFTLSLALSEGTFLSWWSLIKSDEVFI